MSTTPGTTTTTSASTRRPATPLVRRCAARAGVDLADVRATGTGGRITVRDVAAAAADAARWVVRTRPTGR